MAFEMGVRIYDTVVGRWHASRGDGRPGGPRRAKLGSIPKAHVRIETLNF